MQKLIHSKPDYVFTTPSPGGLYGRNVLPGSSLGPCSASACGYSGIADSLGDGRDPVAGLAASSDALDPLLPGPPMIGLPSNSGDCLYFMAFGVCDIPLTPR